MKCPKCGEIEMELVDDRYNLELELEYGHPVEIETYVCPHCRFERSIEIDLPISGMKGKWRHEK